MRSELDEERRVEGLQSGGGILGSYEKGYKCGQGADLISGFRQLGS